MGADGRRMLESASLVRLGAVVMSACPAALIVAPWNSKSVWLMTALAAVAVKGLMAYEVQTAKLGAASGFYTAGGTFAKAVAGGGTLWLLTHLADRFLVATLSIGAALLAATAILLVSPSLSAHSTSCRPSCDPRS
jgi:hypothetical protein